MVLSEKGGPTTIFLSSEERIFLNQQGIGPTEIITSFIRRQKEIVSGLIVDNVFEERKKREQFQKIAYELRDKNEKLERELKKYSEGYNEH